MPRAPRTTRPNQQEERREADAYMTKPSTVATLLPILTGAHSSYLDLPLPQNVLDPCCGDGVFQQVLAPMLTDGDPARWMNLDIRPSAACQMRELDYLTTEPSGWRDDYTLIVSNPPFSLFQEFVDHSFALRPDYLVFLLRLGVLAGRARQTFWKTYTPASVYVLPTRPSFFGNGNTDGQEYAWFVWMPRLGTRPGFSTQVGWAPLEERAPRTRRLRAVA